MAVKSGKDLSAIFAQYLRDTRVPEPEYRPDEKTITCRRDNCIEGFNMPVRLLSGDKLQWLKPTVQWQTLGLGEWFDGKRFQPDRNFYITIKNTKE